MNSLRPQASFDEIQPLLQEILDGQEPGQGLEGWTLEKLKASAHQGGIALGWRIQGEWVAMALLFPLSGAYEVLFLGSSPRYRRQGFMKSLWRELMASMPPEAAVWLEVHEKNLPARKLYEKLGFKEVGQRPHYYRDGGGALTLSLKR